MLTRYVYVQRRHRPARASRTAHVLQGPTGAEGTETTAGLHDAIGVLDGLHDDTTTTITVESATAADFGTGVQELILDYRTDDEERILAERRVGTEFLDCTRGFNGTTATSHLDGAEVRYP